MLFERKKKILIYLSNGSWTNDETLGKLDSSASAWTEQPEKQITYHYCLKVNKHGTAAAQQ